MSRPADEIRADLADAKKRVRELEGELKAVLDAALPFKVGDVVEVNLGSYVKPRWVVAQVAEVKHWSASASYKVCRQKKDGGFSKVVQYAGGANNLRAVSS